MVIKLPDIVNVLVLIPVPAITLPALMFPVADINPLVNKLPASMFALTDMVVPVSDVVLTLPLVMLPTTLTSPPALKLFPVTLPNALIS